ncbi:MAG: M56 family metallopeptidase [Erysipelotrichaceae bacterium]|nr:M56 family metallopeptidase [Erysipelotrichaceae bacterium]MDY5251121.1 M56 family metallopeptidase [Erysipelotrichaceae bacterium]
MSLVNMSISASIMIIVILLIRTVTIFKMPKHTFVILWYIVLFRLLIPFSIPSHFSIYSFLNTNDVINNNFDNNLIGIVDRMDNHTVTMFNNSANSSRDLVFQSIWFAGVIITFLIFVKLYWDSYQKFQISINIENAYVENWLICHKLKRKIRICESDLIGSYVSYGIFKPVILVPSNIDWGGDRSLEYILEHEFIHIKRFDSLTKVLFILGLCVHWFNPFVWLMYVVANQDIELSCDEKVIKYFGEEIKAGYAYTLIGMEEHKNVAKCGNFFSKNKAEERITAIMKTKKRSFIIVMLSAVLIIGTIVLLATSSSKISSDNNKDYVNVVNKDNIDHKQEEILKFNDYKLWSEIQINKLHKYIENDSKYLKNDTWVDLDEETLNDINETYNRILNDINNGAKIIQTLSFKDKVFLEEKKCNHKAHGTDAYYNIVIVEQYAYSENTDLVIEYDLHDYQECHGY